VNSAAEPNVIGLQPTSAAAPATFSADGPGAAAPKPSAEAILSEGTASTVSAGAGNQAIAPKASSRVKGQH